MKIVIAGGQSQAEFIIEMYREKANRLIVVNQDPAVCDYLVKTCDIPVINGQPWRKYVLEEADAYDADLFVALSDKDADNFASCMLAKQVFSCKKCICVVQNPHNVDLYKSLGVDSVVSSTYLLAQSIRAESSVASLVKTLSLDDDKITVTEFTVLSKLRVANKRIRDLHFPTQLASIAAVRRGAEVMIPNGNLLLLPRDILLVVCIPNNLQDVIAFLNQEEEAPKEESQE